MTWELLSGLVALALIDSTSFGTFLIPIWLMLAPGRIRVARILVFLGTVAAFYLALGILLVTSVARFSDQISEALDTTPARVLQFVLGVALVAAGVWVGLRKARASSGRMLRWRERAVGDESSIRGLMALAVTAAVIEAGSMVPYLAAIGLIGTADLAWPLTLLVLVGYCLVMILPAIVLLIGRVAAASVVQPVLHRVNDWMERTGRENTAWLLGIVGVLVAGSAVDGLGI